MWETAVERQASDIHEYIKSREEHREESYKHSYIFWLDIYRWISLRTKTKKKKKEKEIKNKKGNKKNTVKISQIYEGECGRRNEIELVFPTTKKKKADHYVCYVCIYMSKKKDNI